MSVLEVTVLFLIQNRYDRRARVDLMIDKLEIDDWRLTIWTHHDVAGICCVVRVQFRTWSTPS